MSLCRALANPADRVAWYALLRAPWCGLTLADLLALTRAASASARASVPAMLASPDCRQALNDDARGRLQHLAAALDWAAGKRDRLALRVWVEQLWLRLGGPSTLPEVARLRDAERFFELLQQAEAEGVGLDVDWLQRQLEALFASGDDPGARLQVMTLHKAKGLEFDWVFIPGLDRATRGDSRDLLLWDEYSSPGGERGFLLAADDHTADNEPGLYNFLRHTRREKTRLETTRLLYVGATRAARRLVLSANLNADPDGEGRHPPAYRDPTAGTLLYPLWNVFRARMQVHEPLAGPENHGGEMPPLLWRCALAPHPPSMPESASAEGSNIPDRNLNRVDRHVGTVIHLALEQLSLMPELPTQIGPRHEAQWRRELHALGLFGRTLDDALARVCHSVQTTLGDETGRWLLCSTHPEACSELPLTWVDPEDKIRDLVIDRTFVDADNNVRWIVDYKSSAPAEGESLQDFLDREAAVYSDQLTLYRDSIQPQGGGALRCALYFTSLGVLHHLPELDLEPALNRSG
jgi:ATP-dependent exoDNAse (exonuclease V) beta subunit